jgi:signal transduction histidine kinase/DNA-binding response OmpR family regulator
MNLSLENFIQFAPQDKTILVVDDDPINLEMISAWLRKTGFQTLIARNGNRAVQSAASGQPDLILLDVMMPDIDGFETCQLLKSDSSTKNIPVIFMTALTDTENKIRGFEAGAVDYITKPVREEEFFARIVTHLNLRALNEQLEQIVMQRTQELTDANQQLQQEIEERNQVEKELSQRNRELALLNRIIAASASSLEPEAILELACTELGLTFGLPYVSAALLNDTETLITIVAEYSQEKQVEFVGLSIALEEVPFIQQKIPEKKPVIIEDVQSHPDMSLFSAQFAATKTISLAVFPLLIEQKLIGSLNLSLAEEISFSNAEYQLAQNVAEQVSSTLARAQLNKAHQQLEEQYRQSQKMEAIGRLAGGMAHDFNNLLTVITGYTELLLYRHIEKDTPQYREIEQIHKAGKRASTLTRQLLAFSRQQVIQPKELDLNAIINDINEMIRRLISENIDLVTILDPLLGRIKADPGQIEQIIVNLVVNAYDAMPQGGTLTIKTTNIELDSEFARHHVGLNPGKYVKFTISDTGIGMDEETKLHIFEPFFTTKVQGKGTGLGLSMVYGIVQQNEGYIAVQSQPGQGTTFDIYLPRLAQSKEAMSEGTPETGAQPGTETVLLVEDEDMVRQLARYALLENGYQVLEARNGRDALTICKDRGDSIDLLLTDVVMPGKLSGRELAKQLETQYPQMKVLYMSGYTDDTIVRHGIMDANLAFLQKPFSPTTLTRKVREVLDS